MSQKVMICIPIGEYKDLVKAEQTLEVICGLIDAVPYVAGEQIKKIIDGAYEDDSESKT